MKRIIWCSLLLLVIVPSVADAAITSVTLTPIDPPTTMSDGRPYYLAGKAYSFRVQAVDPDAVAFASWSTITLSFNGGTASNVYNVQTTVSTPTSLEVVSVTNNASTVNNLDFTIRVRFLWNCAPLISTLATRQVTATVVNTYTPSTVSNTRNILYGIASDMRVQNFAQDGVAADGYVNPYHALFLVTGMIVYDLPGSTSTVADLVGSYADAGSGEITGLTLLRNGTASGCGYTGNANGFTFTIPATYFTAYPLGNYNWTVQCTTATAPLSETTVAANALALNCDQVRIDAITMTGGGGVNVPNYYRSALLSGTRLHLAASLESGVAGVKPMVGDTVITVYYGSPSFVIGTNDMGNFFFNIPNGQFQPVLDYILPLPVVANMQTTQIEYRVTSISGSAFDNEQDLVANPGSITCTPPLTPDRTIYWDNNDPPNNPFVHATGTYIPICTPIGVSSTAGSISFSWTPFPFCPDFYSYRIYYRKGTDPYTIVDRTTTGFGPLQAYDLSSLSTNTATISGLLPVTSYDYLFSAVDVFGQEVFLADRPFGAIATTALSITASISDGVKTFDDNSFWIDPLASARVLRQSAIKVTFVIITAGSTPDQVNIILAADVPSPSPANEEGTPLISSSNPWSVNGTEGNDYYRIVCTKTAPNTYSGYISANNPLIANMKSCRFVVEIIAGAGVSYADNNSETETAASPNPNDDPWTFKIQTATTFTPWPVRILNNVLSSSGSIAYPSYYLTDDGYVTITVTDVMGRPVMTLLDNALRKGGQNIKDNGWDGRNIAGNKCGVGLYYIQVRAKGASSGKVILNETKQVEIAY